MTAREVGRVSWKARRKAIGRADREATCVAARQWSALSHDQAVKAGLTDDQIAYRVHTGQWRRVARKVYVVAGAPMGASGVSVSRDDLLDDIRAASADRHDETALRLALLAAVADLGWNKALDATGDDDAVRARETAELGWWVDQARHALDLSLL